MIAALIYIILFSLLIFFFKKKQNSSIPRWMYLTAFLSKIICGFFLTYIYTNYYPDRKTADIYKYYDDAKVIDSALERHPADYVKIISGIGNDNLYFDTTYYAKMNNWYKRYDFGTYNDNHTIIRFNALVMPIAFGSFHVHTVFMCMLSFIGLSALVFVFIQFFPQKKWLVFLSVFFVPSVLFWGSGVLKEGILLFSIGILIYSFYKIAFLKRTNVLTILLLILSLLLLLINKNYLLLCLVPPLLCLYIVWKFNTKKTGLIFLGFHALLILIGFVSVKLILHKDPLKIISHKQRDFINLSRGGIFLLNNSNLLRIEPEEKNNLIEMPGDSCKLKQGAKHMRWSLDNFNDTLFVASNTDSGTYKMIWDLPKAGSLIQNEAISTDIGSFIAFAPKALYNSMMQPAITKARSLIEKMAAIENIFLVLFLIFCFAFSDFKNTNIPVLNMCVYAVLILFLIIGYTTPVAGAIVRYKMPLLPLLLMIGINVLSIEKIKRFLPFLKTKEN
ncbi:MAG: hypothetical protein Q8M29_15210 [Bacteroidota bacterium]|nr:hypothetical protein [Bacteroidota bacterium]